MGGLQGEVGERATGTGWGLRWLTTLGLAVAVGMVAFGALVLVDARKDAWEQAEQASDNLILALARDISRNIMMYDLSLLGAMDALEQPDIRTVNPTLRHAAIFDRSTSAEYLGSLLILGPAGDIQYDSTALEPHQMNFADRDYFKVHQDEPHAGLFVSRPFRSRLRHGDASLAISRRLPGPDGAFVGVIVGTLRLAYFQDMFATLKLGPHGSVALVRTDGELIVRQPFGEEALGQKLGMPALFRRFANASAGQYVERSPDGVDRAVTYRQIGGLPLLLVGTSNLDDIYAPWQRKALDLGSILAVLCAAVVVLSLLFRREVLRRTSAERDVRAVAASLAVMASTDALTGLANRRTFETELALEWRRTIRKRGPIGLLILDADWFKAYNDRYGHPAGDQVLRRLADCIQENIRRPGDLGARYGGEEFVALLPDTDLPGACATADRIQAAVTAMQEVHDNSPLGLVSISIGVAVARPSLGEGEVHLLRRADAALYEAKRQGRARVCVAAGGGEGPAYAGAVAVVQAPG